MPLPPRDSKEWKAEVKFFLNSTITQREKRAEEMGYCSGRRYVEAMNHLGVRIRRRKSPPITDYEKFPPNSEPVVNLPPVELKDYVPIKSGRKGDPETQVIHLTDHHDGEITPSFNDNVYKQRLDHLFMSAMRITELHRNMYPVNDLVVMITGDMVHGENPFQGAKVESIDKGAKSQIFGLALPKLTSFLLSCKQEFKTVRACCVPGNHGRYSKEAPATSNWDLILYESLKAAVKSKDIEVQVADTFSLITEVQGKKFFLFHGDQCKASMGVPYFSLTKKMMSWYVTYGGFDYGVCGHFHKEDYLRINSRSKLFMGGSMVTDDPFALQVVGTSSIPTQWTWGVHKEKGVTWCYALTVDDKFY